MYGVPDYYYYLCGLYHTIVKKVNGPLTRDVRIPKKSSRPGTKCFTNEARSS
jgi:hypothetical protein